MIAGQSLRLVSAPSGRGGGRGREGGWEGGWVGFMEAGLSMLLQDGQGKTGSEEKYREEQELERVIQSMGGRERGRRDVEEVMEGGRRIRASNAKHERQSMRARARKRCRASS